MDLKVELHPHTAVQGTPIGNVEIEFSQWLIVVNGRHVGYIDKKPGFGIKFLATMRIPNRYKSAIKAKVDEILGHETPPVATGAWITPIATEGGYDDTNPRNPAEE